MGATNSKTRVMCLPAQSGKTRKMIEDMYNSLIELDDENCEGYFNIVICSNNQLLVKQTQTRMEDEMNFDDIKAPTIHYDDDDNKLEDNSNLNSNLQNVYAWISDNKSGDKSAHDIAYRIINDDIKMLLCCAHSIRFSKYLEPLILLINRSYQRKIFNKKINIWIDEADVSITLWSQYQKLTDLPIINNITLVSATIDSIIKEYNTIRIMPFEFTYQNGLYHKIFDNNIYIVDDDIEEDDNASVIPYIRHVFRTEKLSDVAEPGTIWFVPGNTKCVSHDNIRTFLNDRGFYVAVLNSNEKCIYPPTNGPRRQKINLTSNNNEEIGQIIRNIYYEHPDDIFDFPFAITGQLCLGRGITFQYDGFIFTHAIISNMKNKAALYQCAARLAGNIKLYINEYDSATIYMSSKTEKALLEKESLACNLASLVFKEQLAQVSKTEIKRASTGFKFTFKVFDTYDEVKIFGNSVGHKFIKKDNKAPNELLDNGCNPTFEYLKKRQWGINKNTSIRAIPTNDNKWFVCWDGNNSKYKNLIS
jgi:hypothetical protein